MIGKFLITFSKNKNNNDKNLNWVKEIGIDSDSRVAENCPPTHY